MACLHGNCMSFPRLLTDLLRDRTGPTTDSYWSIPRLHQTFTGLFMILLGFHAEFPVWRLKNRAEALLIRFSLTPSAIFLRSELQPWISSRLSSEDTKQIAILNSVESVSFLQVLKNRGADLGISLVTKQTGNRQPVTSNQFSWGFLNFLLTL